MATCDVSVEPWTFTDYYFKRTIFDELVTLTEDSMTSMEKDAKLKAKMYVHPDMVNDFLGLLAKGYKEEFDEAFDICSKIGLTKRHMDAIRGDFLTIQEEIREEKLEERLFNEDYS